MQGKKERDGAMSQRKGCRWMMPYLGGERCGGKPGRRIGEQVRLLQSSLVDEAGHPRILKLATVPTFSFAAIADSGPRFTLAIGCEVISDGWLAFAPLQKSVASIILWS